jgi:hypothetical protein
MVLELKEHSERLTIRFALVVVFSIAMAWMESSTVVYLRTLVDRIDPYRPMPLPLTNAFGATEIVREGATVIMLMTVGCLAGSSWKSRLGFFMTAFGIWDIFYYLFLKVIVGWPHSLLDWDILFLIPLPWWGRVLSPIVISLVLIVLGSFLARSEISNTIFRFGKVGWSCHLFGIAIALYIFMAHSIEVIGKGKNGVEELPTQFNWPLFIVGILFMLMPVFEEGVRIVRR